MWEEGKDRRIQRMKESNHKVKGQVIERKTMAKEEGERNVEDIITPMQYTQRGSCCWPDRQVTYKQVKNNSSPDRRRPPLTVGVAGDAH